MKLARQLIEAYAQDPAAHALYAKVIKDVDHYTYRGQALYLSHESSGVADPDLVIKDTGEVIYAPDGSTYAVHDFLTAVKHRG